MKIKSFDDFTLEECREYLNTHPMNPERFKVEDRLNAILKQKRDREEQEEEQRKLEQDRLSRDVRWIDINQFLSNRKYRHKYRNLSIVRKILCLLVLIYAFLWFTVVYFTRTEHAMYSYDADVQANYTTGVEWLLLEIDFIWPSPNFYYEEAPFYVSYSSDLEFSIIPIMLLAAILFLITHFLSSHPSLPSIYNIEQEEKIKSIRRTQNREGMFGLYRCKKRRIVQLLPMEYDNIYYCGGNSYICVKGNKRGVYNALTKKMVVDVEYDSIDIVNGALIVSKNGALSKLTTDGFRIIE